MALAGRELRADLGLELLMWPDAGARLVRGHEIEHGKEGLPGLAAAPMSLRRALIPGGADKRRLVRQVVIGLDVVRAVIARGAQLGRKGLERRGYGKLRSQSLGAQRRGVHAGDEAGAGRRTDRSGRKGVGVAHCLTRKGIK